MIKILTKIKLYIFPIVIFVISLIIFFTIKANEQNIRLDTHPNSDSFELFIDTFYFPINLFWKSMVLYGIIIAILKFRQSDIQFRKQYKLNRRNVYLNNYFSLKNEFIKTIINFIKGFKNYTFDHFFFSGLPFEEISKYKKYKHKIISDINTDMISDIFQIWYGKLYKSKLEIQTDIINKTTDIFNELEKIDKLDSNFIYDKLYPIFTELGFRKILPTFEVILKLQFIHIYIVLKIFDKILLFDNKEIKNSNEIIYKVLDYHNIKP